jgi:hypothetical protein
LRDELLNGEIFYSLKEVQILTEQWRREYNTIRPHSSLGYRPPAPETIRLKQAVGLTERVVQVMEAGQVPFTEGNIFMV